ncbi:Y+L amino acid transporter 1 [Elysia marginata]|uniref:Y+L amino acid transporter 1 n=1 Tax=Elysia marginata TaxID=1093978 RepID=A0AAV4G8C5_9GAST|nr:Y+L amino acid transporter 1 [Elysia marginata]
MGSLCYSELGTLIPKSGGDYSYVRDAFGDLLAFVYIWVSILLVRPSSLAIMSLTFGTYFAAVFDLCGSPQIFERLAAVACLLTVMLLNCYSVKLSSWATVISTLFKIGSLLVIVVGGFIKMAQGNTAVLATGFQGSTQDPTTVSLAFYDALWAYDGWVNLNTVTEELQKPSKNLPRANIGGVALVILIYLATNIAYFTVMTTTEMLDADAVAVLWGDRVLKQASVLIPITVMISTFGAVNATAFAGGRPVFAAARDGNLPSIFSYIHANKLTPLPSMVFTICLAIVYVFLGSIYSLIDFFSFTAWFFYGMNFVALLVFRVTKPHDKRPYKCPIFIPILMVLISLYLIIAPIIKEPSMGYLYAAIFTAGSVIVYFPLVKFKFELPFADKLTTYIQLVLQVVPASKYVD